jgi:hypothetical protein
MREVHTTAQVDEDGRLEIELQTDLEPGTHLLTILVDERSLKREQAEAELVRRKLGTFAPAWDDPAMSAYDAL